MSSQIDVDGETTFHDSVSGKQLFFVPRGRSIQDFISESKSHGWPSFRDEEVTVYNSCTDVLLIGVVL